MFNTRYNFNFKLMVLIKWFYLIWFTIFYEFMNENYSVLCSFYKLLVVPKRLLMRRKMYWNKFSLKLNAISASYSAWWTRFSSRWLLKRSLEQVNRASSQPTDMFTPLSRWPRREKPHTINYRFIYYLTVLFVKCRNWISLTR